MFSSHPRQRLDIPEGADEKRVFGITEVIALDITVDEVAVLQIALDRLDGAREAWIARIQESEARQQQQTRVERVAIQRRRKCVQLLIPRSTIDLFANSRR